MPADPGGDSGSEDGGVLPSDELRHGNLSPPVDDSVIVPGAADLGDPGGEIQSDESGWARAEEAGE